MWDVDDMGPSSRYNRSLSSKYMVGDGTKGIEKASPGSLSRAADHLDLQAVGQIQSIPR